MKRVVRVLCLVGCLFVFCLASLSALEVPKQPDGYVTDKASLLSPEAKTKLEEFLALYEKRTTNQLVVAVFPALEGDSLEDFSIRLAEQWKVGQKGRDNGVILLVFKEDRKIRIEVGYGLEGVLPDALAGQIISGVITPRFRQGDYEGGIGAGVEAISQAIQGEFKSVSVDDSELTAAQFREFLKLVLLLIFAVALIDFLRYGGYWSAHRTTPDSYRFWEWWFRFAILLFLLKVIFKAFFYSRMSSRGGYYGSNSGFGGFSGGGGSFGGGGASGRW